MKRCLALGGAKNHLIVLPDANSEMASNDIVASMSGCAGQRCMAASAMIGVGKIEETINKIKNKAKNVIPGKNLGSVISKEAKQRIEKYCFPSLCYPTRRKNQYIIQWCEHLTTIAIPVNTRNRSNLSGTAFEILLLLIFY